jgi:diacylglycerol kinase (ATP)
MKPGESTLQESLPGKRRGLGRLFAATRYSMQGLAAAFRHEAAFRLEVAAAIPLAVVASLLSLTRVERALLLASLLLVLIVELLNSAVEAVVDRVSLERHPLARRAKDVGSAAVCLSLVNAAVVWGLILGG